MTAMLASYNAEMRSHFYRLKGRFAKRDNIAGIVHQVRQGNITQLFPAELEFSIEFNGSPIANWVDIVAHDLAEGIAPLPSLRCASGRMQTDADLKRAETKNRIGDFYWRESRLDRQMMTAADWYVTYGFVPFFIEPDMDRPDPMPYLHAENPRHSWYELDRKGRVRVYAHRFNKSVDQLCAEFPEFAAQIRMPAKPGSTESGDRELEMVRWVDGKNVTYFLPERDGLVLLTYAHKMSRPPVVIAERPGEDESPRGQFDDVIWVQVARAIMSILALQAAYDAVQAPIALPDDVTELNYGPYAVIQTQNPQAVQRVNVSLPAQVFAEEQELDQELRTGSRYPDARTGNAGASVITGKGVEALLGTFDSQIKGAQQVLKVALQDATALMFEMDEVWFPNGTKRVNGTLSGRSYVFTYTPKTDINGAYDCTVTYGFAAGLAPAQSIITMLQLEGAGLIAKGTTMENLPFSIDQVQEMRRIDIEASRDALKQGVFALVQASGQMAAAGQDPMPVITMAVDVIKGLQNGEAVEDAVGTAYQTMQQAQQAAQQQAMQAQAASQQAGPGPGEPDQGDQGGGPPDIGSGPPASTNLQQLIAGFRGNGTLPVLQAQVRRSVPATAA